MKNSHVKDYLDYYIFLENPQYAVMLKGPWGCGKTFFIKKLIAEWTESDNDNDTDVIKLNPIYISLNGISRTETINEKIKSILHPFLYSKSVRFLREVFVGIVKATAKLNLDFNRDSKNDGEIYLDLDPVSILTNKSEKIIGKKILVFDDIERCKLPTDIIFGYINNFVEHHQCKVILLSDEQKIKEKYENKQLITGVSYKDFKEKLVGQTFEIVSDEEDALNSFTNDIPNKENIRIFSESKYIIVEIFRASKSNNLRILKQTILDYNHFITLLKPNLKSHPSYSDFIKTVLAYFIIVSSEYKSGNSDISLFQSPRYLSQDEKARSSVFNTKYDSVLEKYEIAPAYSVFPLTEIINFIESGYLAIETQNEYIENNVLFRTCKEQPWEALWFWNRLDDKRFNELFNIVWSDFVKKKITETTILLHTSGILLQLIDAGILKKEKATIVEIAKESIKKIFARKKIPRSCLFLEFSWSKEYLSGNTDAFKEIYSFCSEHVKSWQVKENKAQLKDIFENLNDTKLSNIYSYLNESVPDHSTTLDNTPILEFINGKKLAKQILKLRPEKIGEFIRFLYYRYSPDKRYINGHLEPYHKNDLKCLKDIKSEIEKNLPLRKKISRYALNNLIVELTDIIDKLEQL
jgi:hypothetical protein